VTKLGKANLKEARPAKPEDVYCCMYTSGSSE
jgi:long-chain acyl-CoA synthetase